MANKTNGQEGLALSADAKPRLKWTRQLHEHFVDAVVQLGGADKATPKSVMRVMRIPGLTLYHLKSHLQKYRLAKSQDSIASNKKQAECRLAENKSAHASDKISHPQINETMLQIQLEVQRELQEHIEVQKHLQLRIEAQGKYLQSVLRKARETIAMYGTSSPGMDEAKAELSELVSAVENDHLGSSFSLSSFVPKRVEIADSSTESCLTSLYRAELKSGMQSKPDTSDCSYNCSAESDEIGPSDSARRTGHGLGIREEIDLNK